MKQRVVEYIMQELFIDTDRNSLDGYGEHRENREDPTLVSALRELGLTYLFPYQRLAIANILDALQKEANCDNDAVEAFDTIDSVPRQLVILPTGFGKSACFQIPALMCPGLTVVVYPLLGLMADQARRLSTTSKPVFCISGITSAEEAHTITSMLETSGNAIILTNPEALVSGKFSRCVGDRKIRHLVIDEAHCLAEWGDTFRPAYTALSDFIQNRTLDMLSAFTASASPPVLARIIRLLFGTDPYRLIVSSTDRPNIVYKKLWSANRQKTLRDLVSASEKPILVFTRSRTSAELLAAELRRSLVDTPVYFYHAGLEPEEKRRIESLFLESATAVLTATCAYGMGMDKKNIRTVIHYDIPESAEAYIQEAGRAGRDGEASTAYLIVQWPPQALEQHGEAFSVQSYSGLETICTAGTYRKQQMLEYAYQDKVCRRSLLLSYMGSEDCVCSGCDICSGTAHTMPEDILPLLTIVNKHRYRFSDSELADFLKGRSHQMAARGYGAYASWNKDDIAGTVAELCKSGYLAHRKGLRKGLSLSPEALLLLAQALP